MDEIYGRSGVNETKGEHRGDSGGISCSLDTVTLRL